MIAVATTEREAEAMTARLRMFGVRSIKVVTPSPARCVVLAELEDESASERYASTLRAEGEMAVARPNEGAALTVWLRDTRPLSFDDRLSVCLAWSEHDRGALRGLVELGPGGFGNGGHPTTRMLVEVMMDRIGGGEHVLDVGCGSGVLGLCALRLGADRVVAADVKAEAVDATGRNAKLNDMDDRLVASADPVSVIDATFDVVVANIARAGIVDLAPDLVRMVSPTGWLAVSGISPAQCALVSGFLRPLVEVDRRTSGDWSALVLARRFE